MVRRLAKDLALILTLRASQGPKNGKSENKISSQNIVSEKKKTGLLSNPFDGRNTKKLKTKTADFFVNTGLFSQIVSKKAKIII